jgi:hypothetical protein
MPSTIWVSTHSPGYASRMKLRAALGGSPSSQLGRIADAWKLVQEPGTLRRELVDLLAARLVEAAADEELWSSLEASEREIVRVVARAGGRHEADLLARRLGRSRASGTDADLQPSIDRAVAGLVERGVLFRVFDADEQRRGVYFVLPDELLDAQPWQDGAELAPASDAAPDRVAEIDLASDLFTLASALRREAWGAASRGLAGRRDRTVGEILARLRQSSGDGPGDPGRRWRFLLWLAQRSGWIGREAFALPADDRIEQAIASRPSLPAEALSASPVGDGRTQRDRVEPHASRRRQADALHLLAELGGNRWWPLDDVVRWLADHLDDDDGEPSGPRRDRERRRLEDQLRRWLTGRWYWLGLVRWGWAGAGWSLVAATDALQGLTSGRSAAADPPPSRCSTDDALRLTAPSTANLSALYRVERYLAFGGEEAGARRYRLTPASFDRGVRMGGDADDLRDLLMALLGGPVPDAWQAAITDWLQGTTRVSLVARLLLTSQRPESLDAALAHPAAGVAGIERISPHHALVAGDHVARLLADLAEAGLPVDVEPGLRAEPASASRSAAMGSGTVEAAWVALEVLRRLTPEVAQPPDLEAARRRLAAALGQRALDALDRRATSFVAALANQRRSRARRRVV